MSQTNIPTIGLDLLGGDFSSSSHLLETLDILMAEIAAPFNLIVFCRSEDAPSVDAFKTAHHLTDKRIQVIETDEVILMDDDPLYAIRRKKNSSMILGIKLLQQKKIDALVSTGNTGALVASSMLHLPMLPGIGKAALITLLPTKKDPVAVIDVGANIHCDPKHLIQFAHMGVAFQKSRGIANPLVGLLNIGTEEKKGRAELRETYQLLQETPSFVGNIEGKEVFSGTIHVLVTDGFTGNVFLKTAEGISAFILEIMHQNHNLLLFSKPLITRLEKELYSAEYPGAILCGMDGIIMKCHGDSTPQALKYGVLGALNLVSTSFIEKIKSQLDR